MKNLRLLPVFILTKSKQLKTYFSRQSAIRSTKFPRHAIGLMVFAWLILSVFAISNAQQLPGISYFMNNKLIFNPAAAGTGSSQFNAAALTRLQWFDIQGAPVTNTVWSDYKFAAKKMAIGVLVSNDRTGAFSNTDANVNYAYYIHLTPKLKLSMGLRAGVTNLKYSPNDLIAWSPQDEFLGRSQDVLLPKFGTGFHLFNSKMYVSLSAPDFVTVDNQNVLRESNTSFFERSRNYVLMAGYKLPLSDQYSISPNIYASVHKLYGVRADANLIVEITDYFWAGATYSVRNSTRQDANFATFMAGTNVSSRIKFGYAYEFIVQSSNNINLYTHELNLMITFDNLFKKGSE